MKLQYLATLAVTVIAIALCSNVAYSQGIVRGKIADEFGESLPFVGIYLQSNTAQGTTSDFDGLYEIKVPAEEATVIVFSAVGKQPKNLEVTVKDGEVFVLNVVLEEYTVQIGEGVEIVTKANRASDNYMTTMKKNSATSMDFISSQVIKRTGDSNVPDAVKRISGVSTVAGYVSVRGLADRYIRTTVNGSKLPTLDPFTNNIRTDIFPTGLIDNILIKKTMTPDLPGDWSGAFMSIETKDFPEDLQVNVTTSFGYNSQATFEDIVSSQRSDTDWLGFDNGFRDIPEGVPTDQSQYPQFQSLSSIQNDLYGQFEFLGIAEDLAAYGITDGFNIDEGDIYHQVALNELGFLSPGQFNNDVAVQEAITDYGNTYSDGLFFTNFNREIANYGQEFNDTWFSVRRQAPINFSQSFTIGNQTKVFKKPLGYVVGFRYSSDAQYDPGSVLNRTTLGPETPDSPIIANDTDFDQQVSRETNSWSALVDLSYKLNKNNNISLLFMPNFRGQNRVRSYEGVQEDFIERFFGDDQIYEERQQLLYQLETEHFIPSKEIKINLNASYTDGKRNILDFKNTQWVFSESGNQFEFTSTFRPDRRYRYMLEDVLDTRFSVEFPVLKEREKPTKIEFGGAYQYNTRENQQVLYTLQGADEDDIANFGFDGVFGPDRFTIQDSTSLDLYYQNSSVFDDSDIGLSSIYAGYVMGDYHLNPRLRMVGGARVEYTDLYVDIRKLYDEDVPVDSEDRVNGNGQLLNPGEIQQVNVLPSINVIYKLKEDDKATMNLRANYSRSLARPSFRELTNLSQIDYELRARVKGNPNLEMTDINNFDLRLESYFSSGTNISVSFFYKTFKNHIELIQAEGEEFTWQNADDSEVFGIEIEGKKDLTRQLELRANVTLIDSRTTITIPVETTRQMFGQAPYIINGMLTYNMESIGLSLTGSYNVQGPKLAVVASSGVDIPDVFEMPRHMLDLKANKTLGDHFSVSFSARNLLNAPFRRAYKFDEGYILDFDNYRWGTNYKLSISYTL